MICPYRSKLLNFNNLIITSVSNFLIIQCFFSTCSLYSYYVYSYSCIVRGWIGLPPFLVNMSCKQKDAPPIAFKELDIWGNLFPIFQFPESGRFMSESLLFNQLNRLLFFKGRCHEICHRFFNTKTKNQSTSQ